MRSFYNRLEERRYAIASYFFEMKEWLALSHSWHAYAAVIENLFLHNFLINNFTIGKCNPGNIGTNQ